MRGIGIYKNKRKQKWKPKQPKANIWLGEWRIKKTIMENNINPAPTEAELRLINHIENLIISAHKI